MSTYHKLFSLVNLNTTRLTSTTQRKSRTPSHSENLSLPICLHKGPFVSSVTSSTPVEYPSRQQVGDLLFRVTSRLSEGPPIIVPRTQRLLVMKESHRDSFSWSFSILFIFVIEVYYKTSHLSSSDQKD